MKLKIAFLQLIPNVNIKDNIEKGIKACYEAREKGADIVLFPEMWSCGYVFPHNEEWLEKNSISLDSKYVKTFSEKELGNKRKLLGTVKRSGNARTNEFFIVEDDTI